jgi:negative regulator of flagellin synthesis FlgM
MKIGPIDIKHGGVAPVDRKGAAPAPAGGSEPSAKVELSTQAAMSGGEGVRADFDSAKVDRISQAIRDGKFEVNAEAIADKLIANARELLPKLSH